MSWSLLEHWCFSGLHSRLSGPKRNPMFSLSLGIRLAHSAPWPRFKALPEGHTVQPRWLMPGLPRKAPLSLNNAATSEKVKDSGSACGCKASTCSLRGCLRAEHREERNQPTGSSISLEAEPPRDGASHPQVSLLPWVPGYRATDTALLSIQRKVYRHTLMHLLRPFNLVYLKINGASNLNSNTHFCLIHGALWSLILLSWSWRAGRRLAGTGAHRSRQHPDCDARLLGVLPSQLSQGCFASTEMALKGGTVGDLQKGEKAAGSQNLQSSKAALVKAHCLQDRWLKFRSGYLHLGHSAGDSAPGSLSWLTCQTGIHDALHGVFKGLTRTTHTRCVFQYLGTW